jgi:hypothetical protein
MKSLQLLHTMEGYAIHATDGNIGKVREFYFDDQTWKVRYVVVDVEGKKVLLSPISIKDIDWEERIISVSVAKSQVQNSPCIDTDMPVSRQYEEALHRHYGWQFYLGAEAFMGRRPSAREMLGEEEKFANKGGKETDPHLRSTMFFKGNRVNGLDGHQVGKFHDFALDAETWALPFMVVKLHGKKMVLMEPSSISAMRVEDKTIDTDLSFMRLHALPLFDASYPTILCIENLREMEEQTARNAGRSAAAGKAVNF